MQQRTAKSAPDITWQGLLFACWYYRVFIVCSGRRWPGRVVSGGGVAGPERAGMAQNGP